METLSFFKHRGKLFYFLFCSSCPSRQPLIHVEGLPVVRFPPFLLPLVRACSHTSSECPSEFSASAFHCFILKSPKGSRFSVVKCFHRLTCLTFRLPPFALACFILRKLPGYPPPLFQLVAGCFALRFRCGVILLLFIFYIFVVSIFLELFWCCSQLLPLVLLLVHFPHRPHRCYELFPSSLVSRHRARS